MMKLNEKQRNAHNFLNQNTRALKQRNAHNFLNQNPRAFIFEIFALPSKKTFHCRVNKNRLDLWNI